MIIVVLIIALFAASVCVALVWAIEKECIKCRENFQVPIFELMTRNKPLGIILGPISLYWSLRWFKIDAVRQHYDSYQYLCRHCDAEIGDLGD